MISLHGFASSNYYNIVKHVLMHKQIPFNEVVDYGGTEEYLAVSPVGKVPAITTEKGEHLSESSVCCDYLEETYPDNPLYPSDSYARNHVRQIMKISELYLELPARRFLVNFFSNTEPPQSVKAEVAETMDRGVGAMKRLCRFDPYLAGDQVTMADIYVRYVLKVATLGASSQLKRDLIAEIPGLDAWCPLMDETDIARKIDADSAANQPEFLAYIQKRLGG
ncbi:MAG: glutathione S-transferase family protein [Pseudomonadales bacterium]|nr:glutathione S-transferase family protein [Pseudomonadales bacterium]